MQHERVERRAHVAGIGVPSALRDFRIGDRLLEPHALNDLADGALKVCEIIFVGGCIHAAASHYEQPHDPGERINSRL